MVGWVGNQPPKAPALPQARGSFQLQEASPVLPVMVQQHVDNTPEAVWVLGGEEAAADLVHGLPQLGQPVVVLFGIIPVGTGRASAPRLQAAPCVGARYTLGPGLPPPQT